MKQVKNNEKGMAFVALLIAVFFLSMISIIYLLVSHTQQDKSSKQEQTLSALPTAEAGLDRAIWHLIKKAEGDLPNWSAPTPSNPVKISESLNKKSAFTAEIYCISAPGGGGGSQLPPRPNEGWYIHPSASNLPRPKGNSGAVTINGVVFMFGGYGNPTKSTAWSNDAQKDDINYWGYRSITYADNVMLAYNPQTDTWTDLGANPYGNKSKFAGVNYNNKMYMFGPEPDVVVYNPGNNLLDKNDDTWSKEGSMNSIRGISNVAYHSAVVIGDKIYVIGGDYTTTQGQKYGLVLEYNPVNNQFRELTPLPDGRYYGAAGVIKDKIYYMGGIPQTGMSMGIDPSTGEMVTTQSGRHSRTVWKYDPKANNGNGSSSVAAHMPWLQDNPNTRGPEHLDPYGGGDKVNGFNEFVTSVKAHVRDPEYSPYWGSPYNEGYGVDHGLSFSNRPGLADHQAVVVDDEIYVIGGNNGLLRTYLDGPGYRYNGVWYGTNIADNSDPNKIIYSQTTKKNVPQRDLFYDLKGNTTASNNYTGQYTYDSYQDWQGQLGSYHRWNKELYRFDGTSWTRLSDARTMNMETNGGMQGVGITNHALAAVDGRFYMLGGTAHHFRDPNRTYLNDYVVEGDDTRYGRASKSYVNAMYLSVAEYYIRPESQTSGTDGVYKIISTGTETIGFLQKTVSRRIEALVKIKPMTGANGFDGSIISKSGISGMGNAKTDSYNSNNGGYSEGINDGQEGNIFSNAGISLVGNTLIDGDAHSGPGNNISLTGNAKVTGDKGASGQEISLPSVVVPGDASNVGEINGNLTLTTGIYTCSGINLNGQERLIINGNVQLYCTGNIQISGQGSIDNTGANGQATNFHIYCTNNVTSIDVVGNGEFFGTIYAPGAEIKISGNGNVYGQLIGNAVKFNGNGKVIYDEQLKNTVWWPEKKMTRDIIYWREVGL